MCNQEHDDTTRKMCQQEMWDMFAIITTAAEKGFGKGREEGRAEATLQNARRMKAKGYPLADIADLTGITISEIESLQSEFKTHN